SLWIWLQFVIAVVDMARAQEASNNEIIILGKNTNQTLKVEKLSRVAVGNSKLIKVKAIPPATILITGLSLGKTSLRVWDENEIEKVFSVSVVPSESLESSAFNSRGQVARVSLQFLELNENIGRNSGIQWPETLTFAGAGALQSANESVGLNYSLSFSTATGFLQLLIKEGWARIVANPDLYVRLGEQALFHSGGEFPVTTASDSFGRFQRKVDWKKYGLTAKVRPESPDQIHFQTDIQLEISEVDHSYQVESIPSIISRTFSTKMDSLDRETVILSGLVRQTTQVEEQSLPILGEIPLLGPWLFTRTNSGRKDTDLLMAVTIGMTSKAVENESQDKFQKKFQSRND
ncbi:MAG: pilus assembly protein N-terminal domain-containing protein, partial [Pseudomonadota bacterium]